MMTIVTPSSPTAAAAAGTTDLLQPVEWKSLLDHLLDSTKVLEWIQSIRRWEELFQRDEDLLVTAFAYVSTYSLVQLVQRGHDQAAPQLLQCGKILLKYLLEKVLPGKDGDERLLPVNAIGSWCSGQCQLSVAELKESIELIKRLDLPSLEQRRCRTNGDLLDTLYPHPSLSSKSKYFAECLTNYFHQIRADEAIRTLFLALPRPGALKSDLEFLRRAFQLPIFDPLDLPLLKKFVELPFRLLRQVFDSAETLENESIVENFTRIAIDFGSIVRRSTRLPNARQISLNYFLRLAIELREKLASNVEPYFHFIGLLLYSVREVIGDLSFGDRPVDRPSPNFDLTETNFSPAQRYSFLKSSQIFKYLLDVLFHLANRNENEPKIPDAPPLLIDLPVATPTSASTEETYDLDNLFSEKNPSTPKPLVQNRSIWSTTRQRAIFNRYLEWDRESPSQDQDDFQELQNFLDQIYLNENLPILIDDVRQTLNSDEQIAQIAALIERSNELPRLIDHLLQANLLDETKENLLLKRLGVELDGPWTLNASFQTLLILLKILFKRENVELIASFWSRFVRSFVDAPPEQISLEQMQIFLLLFHQLNLTQKKSLFVDLTRLIETNDGNVELLHLFDYFLFHFYEIPPELVEQIQSLINKNDKQLTRTFSTLLTKTSANHLDSFALKTLYGSASYPAFYSTLIERLDFTRPKAKKTYQEFLWKILGFLPPPKEYLERVEQLTDSVHLLHLFRLEKKILGEKSMKEFFGDDFQLKEWKRFGVAAEKTSPWTLFDLVVYQILFQNLSASNEQIDAFYRIFLNEYETSLQIDPYERSLASIPLARPAEEKTKASPLPTLPSEFDELFKVQMTNFFDQSANLRALFLRELLHQLVQLRAEIQDKEIFFDVQLNQHFHFLKDQLKFSGTTNFDDELNAKIYREIFRLLFDPQLPNAVITDEVLHDLIKYLDEHFHVELFQRSLAPHDLFDLLYLTANEKFSVVVFARMLTLFNRIFAHSQEFQPMIKSLQRLADLTEEQLAQWLIKLGSTGRVARTGGLHARTMPTDFGNVYEIFDQEERRRNDDDRREIVAVVAESLDRIGEEIVRTRRSSGRFPADHPTAGHSRWTRVRTRPPTTVSRCCSLAELVCRSTRLGSSFESAGRKCSSSLLRERHSPGVETFVSARIHNDGRGAQRRFR